MATWPYRPQLPLTETLEWHTDVIRCYSTEQRQCLRTRPRMTWQHSYHLDYDDKAAAVELCRSNAHLEIDVPEWTSLVDIAATSDGTTLVTVPSATTIPAYKVGGKAIIWESPTTYEVVTVAGVSANAVSISATTSSHGAATMCPMRSCKFINPLECDLQPADFVTASAVFRCDVTEDLTPNYGVGIGYAEYRGIQVVTDTVELFSGAKETTERDLAVLDSVVGLVDRRPVYAAPNRTGVLAWYCGDRAELWNRRRWLHSRKGRQKNFWAPSWNADVVITRDITGGDATLEIAACNFASTFATPCDFAIIAPDGGIWPVRVTGATAGSAGRELLALESAFVGSVSLANIATTCKLTLSRFGTDSIEIHHLTGGQATVAVSVVEDPNVPVST